MYKRRTPLDYRQSVAPSYLNECPPLKKGRLEDDDTNGDVAPSRVVFVRNLPRDVNESELIKLASPFDVISNVILARKNGTALVELANEKSAMEMIDYYSFSHRPYIHGKGPLVVTFSKFQSLTTSSVNPKVANSIAAANKTFLLGPAQQFRANHGRVLLIQVDRPSSQFDYDYRAFDRVFSRFGNVLRIVVFRASSGPRAFVEFERSIQARAAKIHMDGAPLFPRDAPDASIMTVEYSRQSAIEVRPDDSQSMDFTLDPPRNYDSPHMPEFIRGAPPNRHPVIPSLAHSDNLLEWFTEDLLNTLDCVTLSMIAGRVMKPLLKAALSVGGSQANFLKAQADVLEELVAGLPSYAHQQRSASGISNLFTKDEPRSSAPSPVVYVSNLDTERVTPDSLFILFGVYGDVLRVKLFHNKKDNALVQFTDPEEADLAIAHLDGVQLFGKKLRCMSSKNPSITLHGPSRDENGSDQTSTTNKDYSFHRLHRFKAQGSRNLNNVTRPTKFLHIGNLPDEITEDDVIDMFARVTGFDVVNIKMLKGKKPMALVELTDADKAIEALVILHDYEISNGSRIRVSFTKSTIG